MEPWSIVAEHPLTGEPFGIVFNDDSTMAEAEYIARQLLISYRLTATFLPTTLQPSTEGHYLILYTLQPNTPPHLATIWASSLQDAQLRLATLEEDGILFMPAPG